MTAAAPVAAARPETEGFAGRVPESSAPGMMRDVLSSPSPFLGIRNRMALSIVRCKARVRISVIASVAFVWIVTISAAAAAPVAVVAASDTPVDSELERQPSWSSPADADVRQWMLEWITATNAAADVLARTSESWPETAAATASDADTNDRLERAMATFGMLDPRCAALKNDLSADREWLAAAAGSDSSTATFQRNAVKLWLGREFVRHDRFDDGLAMLADLDPAEAIDPAALLFHRAACQHWLLEADAAVASLDCLLERSGSIPVRYERLARLMRADVAALEDESLDHISRRMRDITRRLDQGRAGPKTRVLQDGVIESLDKLIAAIEKKQQECQSQSSAGAGSSGRGGEGKPMDDSRLADGKGPGEVTRRDLGDGDGWGNLPPHKRDEALQQIGREFPAHYREAIEQYFKRLAAGSETP